MYNSKKFTSALSSLTVQDWRGWTGGETNLSERAPVWSSSALENRVHLGSLLGLLRDFLGVSSTTAEPRELLLTCRRDRVTTTRPTSMATAPCGVVVPAWPSEPSMEGTAD